MTGCRAKRIPFCESFDSFFIVDVRHIALWDKYKTSKKEGLPFRVNLAMLNIVQDKAKRMPFLYTFDS